MIDPMRDYDWSIRSNAPHYIALDNHPTVSDLPRLVTLFTNLLKHTRAML